MICRVALHEKTPGSVTSDEARAFRQWIKEHPGFVGGYHVQDSKTGRMLSITIWDSEESMEALSAHASLLVTVVALYNSVGLITPPSRELEDAAA